MVSSALLFFHSTIFILHSLVSTAQLHQGSYKVSCSNITWGANSLFPANLNSSLSALSAHAARSNGFYNSSYGQGPDTAYGLFLCRGDISPQFCQSLVKNASEEIRVRCPNQVEAIIWHEQCMSRYSNRSIFSKMEETPTEYIESPNNISHNPHQFYKTLKDLMDRLVTQAIPRSSRDMFAVGRTNATMFLNIHGLVQCTPDISQYSCSECLKSAVEDIRNFFYGKEGGRVLKPSCNVRYELYRFYNTAVAQAPPHPVSPPPAQLQASNGEKQIPMHTIITTAIAIALSVMIFSTISICYCFVKKHRKKYTAAKEDVVGDEFSTVPSLQFDLATIEAATNNFSQENKIGEGGFGPVYKGTFSNGQEIAVKRLSKYSGQGANEFKNEVVLVAMLQHRNLVRLLGFCLEQEEKILVYEFVCNKSLDYFLFELERQKQLDWSKRYKIIIGIARGILYLHEDSRLKIIHRDLKASNILLDEDMNPKISDFGMARIVGMNETHGNTRRIVGTYGYMSPEYAMHGHFSVKSDVFSFGVLILEIISGKKNSSFLQPDLDEGLLSYGWKHWNDGTALELLDPNLSNSYSKDEVIRCIHIGLICVQEDVANRPTMATIVSMLSTQSVTLPFPQRPAFFARCQPVPNMLKQELGTDQSTSKSMRMSGHDVLITEVHPR